MKTCKKCLAALPLSEFYVHQRMADGYLSFCKPCVRARVTKHRADNKERIMEYDRNRPNKAQRMYLIAERSVAHPKIRLAHVAVHNAIKRGKLVRMPCEVCGAKKVDAHHDDYEKRLEVRWLCRKHHREHHVRVGGAVYTAGPWRKGPSETGVDAKARIEAAMAGEERGA
jgi:hypothetical protein